jgi:signal transduction histidine kinase
MSPADDEALRRALRHDLRNPIAVILGRCELLQTGVNGPLSDAQRHSIDAIARAATKLQEMIEHLAEKTG